MLLKLLFSFCWVEELRWQSWLIQMNQRRRWWMRSGRWAWEVGPGWSLNKSHLSDDHMLSAPTFIVGEYSSILMITACILLVFITISKLFEWKTYTIFCLTLKLIKILFEIIWQLVINKINNFYYFSIVFLSLLLFINPCSPVIIHSCFSRGQSISDLRLPHTLKLSDTIPPQLNRMKHQIFYSRKARHLILEYFIASEKNWHFVFKDLQYWLPLDNNQRQLFSNIVW